MLPSDGQGCDLQATLDQQVAGLRFLLSCLTAWQFQQPLDALLPSLKQWATEDVNKRQPRLAPCLKCFSKPSQQLVFA